MASAEQNRRRARVLQLQAQARARQQAATAPSGHAGAVSAFDETAIEPIPTREEIGQNFQRSVGALDQLMRATASGMTFGLADELAAGANTLTGLGPGQTYEENLAAERARDAAMAPATRAIGEGIGALATGTGLARGGLSLLRRAKPTVSSMAGRGAAEGALYGAAHGAGRGEGAEDRIKQALLSASLGGVAGAGAGALGGLIARRSGVTKAAEPPTTERLFEQGDALYERALDTGEVIPQAQFSSLVDDLAARAKERGFLPGMYPRISAAMKEIEGAKGTAPTMREAYQMRRFLGRAGRSNEADERAMAREVLEIFDDQLQGMKPELGPARELWSRASRAKEIEDLVGRAQQRSAQFSGSGYENALRTEFRNFAMNEKKMRGFLPQEQELIRRVGEGTAPANVARYIGKLAPTGTVSMIGSPAGGAGLGVAMGIDPMITGAAVPAVGLAGRAAATRATAANARNAIQEIQRAARAPVVSRPSPRLEDMVRSLFIGGGLAPAVSGQ